MFVSVNESKVGLNSYRRHELSAKRTRQRMAAAKKLFRKKPKNGKRLSLKQISTVLAQQGYRMTSKYRGDDQPKPFNPTIQAMLAK